ncbi:MAG: OmpA family protein [Verrucomicrobiota bacterium]
MPSDYDWHPVNQKTGSVFKVESKNLGWWVLLALMVSVVIHIVLIFVLKAWRHQLPELTGDQIVFQARKEQPQISREDLERILSEDVVDTSIPEDSEALTPDKVSDLDMVDNSLDEFDIMEKIKEESVRLAPAEAPQIFSGTAPKAPAQAIDLAAQTAQINVAELFSQDLQDMRNKLVDESSAVSINQPVIQIDASADVSKGVNTDEFFKEAAEKTFGSKADDFIEGYSSLDGLLARAGGLPQGEEKILMPTDILFEYNEHELKEEASLSLMKLAFLIETNPNTIFRIEGHTDTFGGVEFNERLSLKRAQAVKDWLIKRLQIDPANIEVAGIGKAKPLDGVGGTAEEQALNRRVEIITRTP